VADYAGMGEGWMDRLRVVPPPKKSTPTDSEIKLIKYLLGKPVKGDPCRYAVLPGRGTGATWRDCGEPCEAKLGDDWYCRKHYQALSWASGR